MLGPKKKGPSRPTKAFAHADGCKIVTADPGFQPEWQENRGGPAGGLPVRGTAKTSTSHASTRSARSLRSGHLPPRAVMRAPGRSRSRHRQGDPEGSGRG